MSEPKIEFHPVNAKPDSAPASTPQPMAMASSAGPSIEFIPQAGATRQRLKAGAATAPSHGQWSYVLPLGIAVVLILVAILQNVFREEPTDLTTDGEPSNTGPTATPATPSPAPLTQTEIERTNWVDNPVQLSRQLELGTILYSPRPGMSRARINSRLCQEGEEIEGYVVVAIKPGVVFLRDQAGTLHRLIDPNAWEDAARHYKWMPVRPERITRPSPASDQSVNDK